jgi:hypothetical protein
MPTVEKIVIHYKEKGQAPKVIKDGLALYTLNNDQDAEAEFVGIDSREKMVALLNALNISLKMALNNWDKAEEMEKGLKK